VQRFAHLLVYQIPPLANELVLNSDQLAARRINRQLMDPVQTTVLRYIQDTLVAEQPPLQTTQTLVDQLIPLGQLVATGRTPLLVRDASCILSDWKLIGINWNEMNLSTQYFTRILRAFYGHITYHLFWKKEVFGSVKFHISSFQFHFISIHLLKTHNF